MRAVGPAGLIAAVLVGFGILMMTIAVIGMLRMPDVYTRLHAASKAVILGLVALLAASAVIGPADQVARAVMIGVFLVLTTPLSAHAIARARERRGPTDAEDEGEAEEGGE